MAKPKTEPTAAMKAAEAAREALTKAQEKHAKSNNADDLKNVQRLKTDLQKAVDVENRERFEKYAVYRTGKALEGVQAIAGLLNPRSYKFQESDRKKIVEALKEAVENLDTAFGAALAGGTVKAKSSFTL